MTRRLPRKFLLDERGEREICLFVARREWHVRRRARASERGVPARPLSCPETPSRAVGCRHVVKDSEGAGSSVGLMELEDGAL